MKKEKDQKKKVIKKYKIYSVSEDGLMKPAKYGSFWNRQTTEYDEFNSEEEAMQFCVNEDIVDVIIIPYIRTDWD